MGHFFFFFFFFQTCCPVRPSYFHKDLTTVRSYLLAACDNIQKGHYISPKQLTNWLVTLFIMSHTCDKLFNSVTPNKSKSKQLANAVWGLFVAIYRCSQAVTALQSTMEGGDLLMTHLRWQPLHSTHGSDGFGSQLCSLKLPLLPPAAVYMFAVRLSLLEVAPRWKHGEGGTACLGDGASAAQGCSVGQSSGLQETPRAARVLIRRDNAGKSCWLHVELLFPARCWDGLNLREVGVLFQSARITLCRNYSL